MQGPPPRVSRRDRTSFEDPLYYVSPRPSYSSWSTASLSPVPRDPPLYSSNLSRPPLSPRSESPADARSRPGGSPFPSSSYFSPHSTFTFTTVSSPVPTRDPPPGISLPRLSHPEQLPRSLSFSDDSSSSEPSVQQDDAFEGGRQSRRFNSQVQDHSQPLPRSLSFSGYSASSEPSVEQDDTFEGGRQSRQFNSPVQDSFSEQGSLISRIISRINDDINYGDHTSNREGHSHSVHHRNPDLPHIVERRTLRSRYHHSYSSNPHNAYSDHDSSSVCHFGNILGGMLRRSLSRLFSSAGSAYEPTDEIIADDTGFVQSLTCPISKQIMQDPVVDTYGHSYERSAILQWLERNMTSPNTRQPLRREDLRPNHALRAVIEQYIQDQQRQQLQAEKEYAHTDSTNGTYQY